MKVKIHESQNDEEGYIFGLSAPETILQNIKVIHKLKTIISGNIVVSKQAAILPTTSHVVLCDLDNFTLRPLQVTPLSCSL